MDYKHYKFEDNSYQLRAGKGKFYFLFVLFAAIGGIVIWAAAKTGTTFNYISGALCIAVALLCLNGIRRKVIIDTNTKTVTVKTAFGKEKQYPFSEFLNFQIVRLRNNGIVTQRSVSMFFNENGKNKAILLKQVFGKKRADSLVAETAELLGKNADSDTLTQTTNQYRF